MEARFADLDTEVGAEKLTPFDLGIQWMVSFDDHEFVGRDRLLDYWQSDPAIRPVCWRADGAVVPEPGADVYIDGDGNGVMDDLNRDGRVDVGDARFLAAAAERVERRFPALIGGVGIYTAGPGHGPFVHIDTRGYRARW